MSDDAGVVSRLALQEYADHCQIVLGDSATTFLDDYQLDFIFDENRQARRVQIAPDGLVILTNSYDTVPIVIEVRETAPDDEFTDWDHVVEASIEVPTGRIAIDGMVDFRPERSPDQGVNDPSTYYSPHFSVAPGIYRVRIYGGNLGRQPTPKNTLGEHYKIVLWPASPAEPMVLKQGPLRS